MTRRTAWLTLLAMALLAAAFWSLLYIIAFCAWHRHRGPARLSL